MLTTPYYRVTIELPPTATYAHREADWVPTGDGCGLLVIRLRKTKGGKQTRFLYGVRATGDEIELTREGGEQVAYVCCLASGTCTCRAGECKRQGDEAKSCKHLAALTCLRALGAI